MNFKHTCSTVAAEAADPLAALGWGQLSQGDIYRWLGVLKARSQWEHPFPIFCL